MNKCWTATLLVAGICIGGGTIALPMALAKLGLLTSLIVMGVTWFLTYYTSLTSVELNLQSERGLSLGQLGQAFSGRTARLIGEVSVKLLSYALLAAFFCGGTSILQKLLEALIGVSPSIGMLQLGLAAASTAVLLGSAKTLSKINNVAFSSFLVLFLVLVGAIMGHVDLKQLPWMGDSSLGAVLSVLTVVFTSFGYQVIFHTLRDYCGREPKMLRRAFLYGSMIPLIVYALWTSSALAVLYKADPGFYAKMAAGEVDVGTFVSQLATISGVASLQIWVWGMSILAVLTSILGVGLGLAESFNGALQQRIASQRRRKGTSALITVAPAYIVAAAYPGAFLKILGCAGAILVVLAILLPTYLFFKARLKTPYLKLNKGLLWLGVLAGLILMATELLG